MKSAILHFDGACRGNPGPAGAGYVLQLGVTTFSRSVPMGRPATNNVAEYVGLVAGLVAARRLGVTHLTVRGDSQLVVEQVLGRYRVREPRLMPWRAKAAALAASFDSFDLAWVPREQNGRADWMARQALPDVRAPTRSLHWARSGRGEPMLAALLRLAGDTALARSLPPSSSSSSPLTGCSSPSWPSRRLPCDRAQALCG